MTRDSGRSGAASLDAVVVGSGPNGLSAAITLARAGRSVLVLEGAEDIGGGIRSEELTLPGFVHDVCSAIHPLGVASPFLRTLPLERYGLEWIHAEIPLAHPHGERAAAVYRDLDHTARAMGPDGEAYRRLLAPFVQRAPEIISTILGPPRFPRHPVTMLRYAFQGLRSAESLVARRFRDPAVRALFAGLAAHSVMPLERPLTAGVGIMFGFTAHGAGWPFPRGGSQRLALAMRRYLESLSGRVETGVRVESLSDVPEARAVLFDVSPAWLSRIAGDALPGAYRRRLERFRYGPGVFKVDWALDGPIPWTSDACRRAGTVHVGGSFEEIAASERAAWSSRPSERPFVLLAQHSLFDPSRAPPGKHTGWAYCHVPHGSTVDMTDRIEAQVERFAPGFRDRILARHTMSPADFERRNPNRVGGDVTGGVMDLKQLVARPTVFAPHAAPGGRFFLCSASTPPGGGVHGMCGYRAARAALRGPLRGL